MRGNFRAHSNGCFMGISQKGDEGCQRRQIKLDQGSVKIESEGGRGRSLS